ncbi:hypothetical protein FB451DRAFT_143731 [Mycena latifolia]|nr:hypothetical protein FB451DRAFT_143731 [Mycena latifolia]
MMLYHDGLRTICAETARHSSKPRAPPPDFFLFFLSILVRQSCSFFYLFDRAT